MRVIRFFANLIIFAWCIGYFKFIYDAEHFSLENRSITDVVVVFGGNKQRLYTGAQLVKLGYAPLMFVTGDKPGNEFKAFIAEHKLTQDQFVYDFEHKEKNKDHGRDAARFINKYEFKSVRLVVPSFQIDRALIELKSNLSPYITIIPHSISIKQKNYNDLFIEYNKYVLMLVANLFGVADEVNLSYPG